MMGLNAAPSQHRENGLGLEAVFPRGCAMLLVV